MYLTVSKILPKFDFNVDQVIWEQDIDAAGDVVIMGGPSSDWKDITTKVLKVNEWSI